MIVTAIKCKKCGDTIYSRAVHDFRWCSCGTVAIDGGFDYTRVVGDVSLDTFALEVNATKKELYRDWSKSTNKFGLIKEKKCQKK